MKLKSTYQKILSDTITPVSIYLKIRDHFPGSLLLESSDYHTNNNSFSYICMNPIASFKLENELITIEKQDQKDQQIKLTDQEDLNRELKKFRDSFEIEKYDFKFTTNALFGYTAYDAIRYFENVDIKKEKTIFKFETYIMLFIRILLSSITLIMKLIFLTIQRMTLT